MVLSEELREELKKIRRHARITTTKLTNDQCVMKMCLGYPEFPSPARAILEVAAKIGKEIIEDYRKIGDEADAILRAGACSWEQWKDFWERVRITDDKSKITGTEIASLLKPIADKAERQAWERARQEWKQDHPGEEYPKHLALGNAK